MKINRLIDEPSFEVGDYFFQGKNFIEIFRVYSYHEFIKIHEGARKSQILTLMQKEELIEYLEFARSNPCNYYYVYADSTERKPKLTTEKELLRIIKTYGISVYED